MQLFTHLLSSYLQGMGDFFSALPKNGYAVACLYGNYIHWRRRESILRMNYGCK